MDRDELYGALRDTAGKHGAVSAYAEELFRLAADSIAGDPANEHDPDDVADLVAHDARAMAAMFGGVAVVTTPRPARVEDLGRANGFKLGYDRRLREYTLAGRHGTFKVPRAGVCDLILALGYVERDSDRRHFTGDDA